MTRQGQAHLRRLFESNRVFLTLQDEINVSIVNTFLGVALWGQEEPQEEPLSITELAGRIGLPETTVSRHLRYLGAQRRIGVEGLRLVDTRVHPIDRRRKVVFLTNKGKALRDHILFASGVTRDDGQSEVQGMAG